MQVKNKNEPLRLIANGSFVGHLTKRETEKLEPNNSSSIALLFILLTKTEFLDECAVLVNVFLGVVAQQAFALTYHCQQSATCRVVFAVDTEVLTEAFDAVSQQRYLYFYVSGVLRVA
jgi:hypothetical protein